VPRKPLREESDAWQRVVASGGSVPPELKEWVEAAGALPFFMEEGEAAATAESA
jgi:hypothetical protein